MHHQSASSECVIRVRHQSASSVRLQQSRTVLEESNKLVPVIVAANGVLSSEVTVRQIGTPVGVKSSKNKFKSFPAFISVKQSQ